MYYFGYGSNLRASFVTELLPSAKFLMKGYLPNYEVQWRLWSAEYKGGISSISEAPGEIVQGAIYECPKKEIEKLDFIPGYLRTRIQTRNICGTGRRWSMALSRTIPAAGTQRPPTRLPAYMWKVCWRGPSRLG